jgi:hypothetical protein
MKKDLVLLERGANTSETVLIKMKIRGYYIS